MRPSRITSRIPSACYAARKVLKPPPLRLSLMPYHRLRAQWNGRLSRSARAPANRLPDEAQEHTLCESINTLESMGLAPKRKQIEATANSIRRLAYGVSSPRIRQHWIKRFLRRHSENYRRRRRALDLERMEALDKSSIEVWF